jgi:hypothetical protein
LFILFPLFSKQNKFEHKKKFEETFFAALIKKEIKKKNGKEFDKGAHSLSKSKNCINDKGVEIKKNQLGNYWFENRVDLRIDWFEIKSI